MQIQHLPPARSGERALGAHPRPAPVVPPSWRQRLRFYAGRHLTRAALDLEHRRQTQHLGLVGLRFGAGVVAGLGCRAHQRDGTWHLTIGAGSGLLADGRDVVLDRQVDCRLDELPVLDPVADQVLDLPPRGLGLLVLQPAELGHRGDDVAETAHCRPLEEDLAYADLQLIDATRIGWLPLTDWPGLGDLPPVEDPRARNRLAHALFAFEARVGSLPGADVCLAIAALAVTAAGAVTVCDRHAAWRALAVAPRRAMDRRSPALAQARLLQFADELAERAEAGEAMPGDLQDRMRFLPPVGLLPPSAIDWETRRSDALPPGWLAEALPVAEDQLEALLDTSRDLAALDVEAPEQVQVLVPVPARSYEPELLATAHPDPRFATEVSELVGEVRQARSDRDHLDNMAQSCLGSLSGERLAAHPDPDDGDAVPEETGGSLPPPTGSLDDHAAEAEALLATTISGIEETFPWSAPLIAGLRAGAFPGLAPWADRLAGQVQAADDAVDQFFLALRADIHRLRQVLGGTDTASRIGTSPVLAEIAEGAKGLVDPDRLQTFFRFDQTTAGSASPEPIPDGGAGGGGEGSGGGSVGPLRVLRTAHASRLLSMVEFDRLGTTDDAPAMRTNTVDLQLAAAAPRLIPAAIAPTWTAELMNPRLPWIGGSGGTLRTRQLVDRVRQPPAIEAKIKASATKARILRALADQPVVLGDIEVVLVNGPIALLAGEEHAALEAGLKDRDGWSEFQERIASGAGGRWATVRVDRLGKAESALLQVQVTISGSGERVAVGTLLSRSMRRTGRLDELDERGLIEAVLEGITDPDPLDGDESDYVSTAVATLEGTVALLRTVEGRLHAHRLVLDRCVEVIARLDAIAARWLDHLAVAEATLAEVRHDLAVARGLQQEEEQRILALNRERLRILREEVEVIAFCRPRHLRQTVALPATALLPRFVDPLPAILADRQPLPEELTVLLDVVRQVPIGSFPDLAERIRVVDRRERLVALFRRARDRARLQLQAPAAIVPMVRLAGAAAASLQRLHASWQDRQKRLWQQRSALLPEQLAALSWTGQQQRALAELSLEDLLGGGRDAGDLVAEASALIDRLAAVVGGLYRRIAAIEPLTRLRWVERVSIHDDPGSLLQPAAVLPGWLTLGLATRRELEHLIHWLGERFSSAPEASELASDLVRAAILVAARAPAAELARAHLPEEARGTIGDEVVATVQNGAVRIGMIADFRLGSVVAASGRVTDLFGERIRLQVTSAQAGASFSLPAGTVLALRAALS